MNSVLRHDFADRFPAAYWDSIASDYPQALSLLYRAKKRFDRALVDTESGGRLLDAGCGKGGDAGYFACRSFSRVDAIDHSPAMCAFAAETIAKCPDAELRAKVRIHCMDMVGLGFDSSEFDTVTSFSVIDHIAGADNRSRAFADLVRVLKPGGKFVVSLPNRDALASMLKCSAALEVRPHRVGEVDVIHVQDRKHDNGVAYEVEEPYTIDDLFRIARSFNLADPQVSSGVMTECVEVRSDEEALALGEQPAGAGILLNACSSGRTRDTVSATLAVWSKLPVARRGLRIGLVATKT